MDAQSEAAALSGIAQNHHFPMEERLAAANKALDYYVDNRSVALQDLLDDWRRRRDSDNPSEYLDMQDVVAQLAAIVEGEE